MPHNVVRALSSAQEHRLIAFLDDHFIQLTRGYKKRAEPNAAFPTLPLYLNAARRLLALVLQIPPIDPSTSLRTAFFLRLTGDTLGSMLGYAVTPDVLPHAFDWLDDLDQAWLAVLKGQVWDPDAGEGVDLLINPADVQAGMHFSPISLTERTRLWSLLLTSSASLEDWLYRRLGRAECAEDVQGMLQRLDLQADYDQLFSRTLDYLGPTGGTMQVETPLSEPILADDM